MADPNESEQPLQPPSNAEFNQEDLNKWIVALKENMSELRVLQSFLYYILSKEVVINSKQITLKTSVFELAGFLNREKSKGHGKSQYGSVEDLEYLIRIINDLVDIRKLISRNDSIQRLLDFISEEIGKVPVSKKPDQLPAKLNPRENPQESGEKYTDLLTAVDEGLLILEKAHLLQEESHPLQKPPLYFSASMFHLLHTLTEDDYIRAFTFGVDGEERRKEMIEKAKKLKDQVRQLSKKFGVGFQRLDAEVYEFRKKIREELAHFRRVKS